MRAAWGQCHLPSPAEVLGLPFPSVLTISEGSGSVSALREAGGLPDEQLRGLELDSRRAR